MLSRKPLPVAEHEPPRSLARLPQNGFASGADGGGEGEADGGGGDGLNEHVSNVHEV